MPGLLSMMMELFELRDGPESTTRNRPVSTLAFDSLYVLLSLLLTAGIMLDVWSHNEFGPDQSLFNEYHLLFYSSLGAMLMLLIGLLVANFRSGAELAKALPHGYGLGLLAIILFGISGSLDLVVHALFGFESDVEALTSPPHLLLFINWFLILFAPVSAARTRFKVTGRSATLLESLPQLIAYGCMVVCIHVPLMIYYPLGGNPWMLQDLRPANDFEGLVMGIGGTLLQTLIMVPFILWLAREFRVPFGGYTVAFGFYGLFLLLLVPEQMPWLMFGGLGLLLDIIYWWIEPDATQRRRYILFSLMAPGAMWLMGYSTLAIANGGMNAFYFSGYNLYGSVFQAIALGVLLGYLMSMPNPRHVVSNSMEVSHG
ncbi:MAG: hypothetical protein AAF702_35475 [Chloroflexota bacterium]